MQTENRFFEDFVKMVNGAAGTFAGMAREGEASFKERAKQWIGGLDLVSRDEFEAVKAMAAAARDDVAALKAELAAAKGAAKRAKPADAPTTDAPTTDAPSPGAPSPGVTFPD